ncbi:MFS transporter [Geovibrio thiophilus]|uniref:MFS transporter n=1 Tax=Geovibrio thiophilus TaxID=139438 RepID=A0A3R5XVI3_9BACT|nr:MFS transporter [Geovibrio thiophilus]QAR32163.1 MFS transporter [Geovibrio thiophilus]
MSSIRYMAAVNSSIFVIMFGLGICFTYLPDKMTRLSGSVTMSGFLASAFGLTYILSQYPLGKIADRFGFRSVIIAGFLLCSLSGLIYYSADSARELILGRIVQGVGEAPLWSLSPILLALLYPENKAQVMGWYTASFHFGLTAGPLAGTYIADFFGAETTFLGFSAASVIGGFIILTLVSPKHQTHKKSETKVGIMSIVRPLNKSVLAGIVMYGAAYGLIVSVIPAFMLSVKNMNHSLTNTAFSLSFFTLGIIQIFSGKIVKTHNLKQILPIGMSCIGAGLLVIIYNSGVLLFIGLLAYTAGLGIFSIASMLYLQIKADSAHAGASSGVYFMFWGIGYFTVPFVIGMIRSADLISVVLLFQAVMLFAAAASLVKTMKN